MSKLVYNKLLQNWISWYQELKNRMYFALNFLMYEQDNMGRCIELIKETINNFFIYMIITSEQSFLYYIHFILK